MEVLCGFGSRRIPRPSDGKLRQVQVINYKLPGEDLDALEMVAVEKFGGIGCTNIFRAAKVRTTTNNQCSGGESLQGKATGQGMG
ncbi:hypothetical protein PIB30_074467 [Stylosanthes scabra]|uniref:Uncharacterized protein n=1 Tax=Stylosanthes scabra TaxID=79078 RepID=A0ABU6WPI7_9FABA|nr:hypothetical protein [Stylosanthes scabra]